MVLKHRETVETTRPETPCITKYESPGRKINVYAIQPHTGAGSSGKTCPTLHPLSGKHGGHLNDSTGTTAPLTESRLL